MNVSPSVKLAQDLEYAVCQILLGDGKNQHHCPVLDLFFHLTARPMFFGVTSGFFNKTLADMKKTGIVNIIKSGGYYSTDEVIRNASGGDCVQLTAKARSILKARNVSTSAVQS